MAITYKWTINALDTDILKEGNANVVKIIHWGMEASEGTDPVYTARVNGTHNMAHDKDNFLAYDDLTEDKVIAWLEDGGMGLDVATIKTGLDNQITLQKAPVEKTFRNPFRQEVPE